MGRPHCETLLARCFRLVSLQNGVRKVGYCATACPAVVCSAAWVPFNVIRWVRRFHRVGTRANIGHRSRRGRYGRKTVGTGPPYARDPTNIDGVQWGKLIRQSHPTRFNCAGRYAVRRANWRRAAGAMFADQMPKGLAAIRRKASKPAGADADNGGLDPPNVQSAGQPSSKRCGATMQIDPERARRVGRSAARPPRDDDRQGVNTKSPTARTAGALRAAFVALIRKTSGRKGLARPDAGTDQGPECASCLEHATIGGDFLPDARDGRDDMQPNKSSAFCRGSPCRRVVCTGPCRATNGEPSPGMTRG